MKIWITACAGAAGLAALLLFPARHAQAASAGFVAEWERNCRSAVNAHIAAGGTEAYRQVVEQDYFHYENMDRAQLEHEVESYEESLAALRADPNISNSSRPLLTADPIYICTGRVALRYRDQQAQRAQQQQALAEQQQQQAQRQAMAAPPERPATPSRRKVSEVPPGATQKRGEESDPANPGDEKKPVQIANQCVGLIKDPQAYGGFVNSCDFPVYIAWCAYRPKKGAWSEAFDCDQDKGGLGGAEAHGRDAEHTHNAEKIFWFACRKDATPKVKYTSGAGFFGYCQ